MTKQEFTHIWQKDIYHFGLEKYTKYKEQPWAFVDNYFIKLKNEYFNNRGPGFIGSQLMRS